MHTQNPWIIKDWAGNILTFKNKFNRPQLAAAKEFETFDDAEEFLTETLGPDYEEERGEYYIEEREK